LALIDYDIADDSYYLFTCAELKAREIELIDKSKIDRMLSAAGVDDFFKILQETWYSKYISDIEKNKSFNNTMVSEYRSAINFLNERLTVQHQAAILLLMLKEILHNLKIIIKSFILDKDLKELFFPVMYDCDQLKSAAESGNDKDIDPCAAKILQYGMELVEKKENYRSIELKLELAYLENIFDSVKKIGSRMLVDFLKYIIDIFNIKNIYRYKYTQEKLDFNTFLHKNGFLSVDFLEKFKSESIDYFVQSMERTEYATIIIKGTHSLYTDISFSSFERNEDMFYLRYFDLVKYTVSNLERVFAFFIRKKLELKILNIIYMGLLYDVERGKVKRKVEILNEY